MNLGRFLLVSTTATIVGVAAYAIFKAGGVKPAMIEAVKGTIKAGDWTAEKYVSAKQEVTRLVDEAKADMAEGA
ncbi:hypothetical protein [Maridesulfovibrio ferrireducens]|uniref:Uncharacterized protein n=1 Tax=Maridesulfovibrio ferrireducens TaxID=246191 RepID=A0A1G9H049_9BACT|nr:hypothetical protein [Maridesulfovibrio ferrireducens]MBI9112770.1 hypothetical protein [Maridesulfovibrio ferrireducens]SDL05893.1 hypothetical protein SAMN05660337_1936 [Maridesulfovibrio ferrireducens]